MMIGMLLGGGPGLADYTGHGGGFNLASVRLGGSDQGSVDMTSGQAVVVAVGLALILVTAIAVAAFVGREHVLDRRRTPEERYRREVLDVRRVKAELERRSDRLRARQSDAGGDMGASGGAGGAF
jgi:hypothetical protein